MSSSDPLVTLSGGLIVPLSALQLLWRLEDRGLALSVDGSDLRVRPKSLITDADRVLIRELKPHLIALIAYCAKREAWL